MAVTITKVTGADYSEANKRVRVRNVAFTGNYATGGEVITAAQVGLKAIHQCLIHGNVAQAFGGATATAVGVTYASDGTTVTLFTYESGAANAPLAEKNNAEAYITLQSLRCTFIGH